LHALHTLHRDLGPATGRPAGATARNCRSASSGPTRSMTATWWVSPCRSRPRQARLPEVNYLMVLEKGWANRHRRHRRRCRHDINDRMETPGAHRDSTGRHPHVTRLAQQRKLGRILALPPSLRNDDASTKPATPTGVAVTSGRREFTQALTAWQRRVDLPPVGAEGNCDVPSMLHLPADTREVVGLRP
jgi:hypothetical protein